MDVRRDIAYLLRAHHSTEWNEGYYGAGEEGDRIAREWGLPTANQYIDGYWPTDPPAMTVDEREVLDDYIEGRATDYVLPERFREQGR